MVDAIATEASKEFLNGMVSRGAFPGKATHLQDIIQKLAYGVECLRHTQHQHSYQR